MRTAVLALITALAATPMAAEEPEYVLFGPMRIRDMSPIALLRLDMMPAHAVDPAGAPGGVELSYSRSNIFILSDAAKAYLETRTATGPITRDEAEDMLDLGSDIFIFDGEVSVTNFTIHRVLSDSLQVSLTIPHHSYTGGDWDKTIEHFHESAGYSDAGRPLMDRDSVHVISSIAGERQIIINKKGDSGVGDVSIGTRFSRPLAPGWRYVIEGAAKFPTGRSDGLYFRSGTIDLGLQLSLQRKGKRRGYYGGASFVWVGGAAVIPVHLEDTPTVHLAVEQAVTRTTNVILQGFWSRSTIQGIPTNALTEDRYQLSLGTSHRWQNVITAFGITENISNFQNTPDIGVHFDIGVIIPR
jgi:hypothetical protein